MIWLILSAFAQRPDQGGINSFDSSDVLATLDGPAGLVRVTYSVEGPNVTLLDDDDGDGRPDFPAMVAENAEAVLEMYDALGFRAPLSEADMGIELGGSPAFDFYLVDFGGTADGQFLTDRCNGQVCSGFMVMENDFKHYGYPSEEVAIRTLTSHELFHAVQAAYRAGQESWIAEGTATWSEHQYDEDNFDFYYLCDALLADPGRSLDKPPAGPVPAFAYGTALFWQFLTERYGPEVIVALQEAEDSTDGLDAVELAMQSVGTDWSQEWPVFVKWNLGTGKNQGALESYPFANRLDAVAELASGPTISDGNRFYPLAASYYTVEHPGGPLVFATLDDPTGLQFGLFPAGDEGVGEPLQWWAPTEAGRMDLGDLPAGEYKFLGTYPARAPESVKIDFCLGDEATVLPCLPAEEEEDSGEDTGTPKEEPKNCGCSHSADVSPLALLALGVFWRRKTRNCSTSGVKLQ